MFLSFRLPKRLLWLGLLFLMTASIPVASASAPRVAVSIAPLHSLVSALMQGIAQPALLIPPGQSPHAYQLRPSETRQLSSAELLIWVGPEFEISLRKPVGLLKDTRSVPVLALPGMHLLEARHSGIWESDHGHEASGEHEAEHGEGADPHLWLSGENARVIAAAVANVLVEMDPPNAERYQQNLVALNSRIVQLQAELEATLAPYGELPYLVFHDAYHYFEHEFGLNPVGAVTLSPERKPGVRSVLEIKRTAELRGARCIFHEPQFEPRLVQRIAEESGLWVGQLDPVGAALASGPDLWFELMLGLRDALRDCANH